MLLAGLGHGWTGSSASVAAVVARPPDFARPPVPEWAAESAAKQRDGVEAVDCRNAVEL